MRFISRMHKASQTVDPADFVTLYSLGVEAYNKASFESALDYFERARAVKSDFAPLWHNLGLIKIKLHRFQEAVSNLDQAVSIDPSYQAAIDLRAKLKSSLALQQESVAKKPEQADLTEKILRAVELQQSGKSAEAETAFLEILAADPTNIPALFSLGGIEHARKNHEKALAFFERAMAIKPDYPPLWHNHGTTLQALKQYERSLASYDRAIGLDPTYIEAMMNRGTVLVEMKRHKDALLNYDCLLKIDPNNDKALCNRGIILTDFKLNDAAIATFERLLEISPDYIFAAGLLCFAKLHACDWHNLDSLQQLVIAGVRAGKRVCKSMAFTAISADPHDHLLCARIFTEYFCPPQTPIWQGEKYDHRKIRIAYVSPDFREHPVGHLIAGVFEHHDRNRFETTAISLGIDDGSRLRRRIQTTFDEFIDARQMRSDDIARMLREKEIDILVDLAGYTADSRPDLFALRPTPVQVNFLGYSSTMGTGYHDYIIADRHIIPEYLRDCYSEKVVYLPDTYLPTDASLQIASSTPPRHEYGLPETGFVFCSFNHDYKINPPIFDIWMRLLTKVPGSVLWLMKLNESAETNLRKEATARGINPERIIFATRVSRIEDHLARYRMADLFLDTFPCNAHSTASDVLRAGLPIVTCRGQAFAGRVASGLLGVVGLPELITETLSDYEQLALKLAINPEALDEIKKKLEKNLKTTPLYDTAQYCRNLEQAYLEIHARHQKGLSPDHIAVTTNHKQPEQTGTRPLRKKHVVIAADGQGNQMSGLHIGGKEVKTGWKILNVQNAAGVDFVGDVKDLSQFSDEMFDQIYASHVLEHVSQFQMVATLTGINRILKPDGKLMISVPDLEILCKLFLNKNLDKSARFHVMRMMFGGQVDQYDFHQIGFSEEILMDYLAAANFKFCQKVDEFGIFNDTSSFKPYGIPISLNIIAYKSRPPG